MCAEKRPNVVLVLTDDQGYPDLGCTGNPWIQTPNIDAFSREAVRLQDFHVAPLCAPTRAALMTGLRSARNGVWATCWGRSILKPEDRILPELFRDAGYDTAMFGKWHLGDNYPNRPHDRGFDTVVAHKGGGVGQTPDFWGNNYFDDVYFDNNQPRQYDGYCTDVWFEQAETYIRAHREKPFFCYIATNAPHAPYLVPDRYAQQYRKNAAIPYPEFYGMISCIDENFGRLRRTLEECGLADDTILIFLTDNGSSGSAELDDNHFEVSGYNAGLRGKKGSYYDGGHKVPMFLYWKNGRLMNDDVREMCLHIDLLPTLLSLCGIPLQQPCDGMDLSRLLRGEVQSLPDRYEFLQYRQSTEPPRKWNGCVMDRRWRLINGCELYDIVQDPGERTDVSAEHPDVVRVMREQFQKYWQEVAPDIDEYVPVYVGSPEENPSILNSMDIMGDVVWNQRAVADAQKASGSWRIRVTQAGHYRIGLRRWPEERNLPIGDVISQEEGWTLASYAGKKADPAAICPHSARISLFGATYCAPVNPKDPETVFEIALTRTGETNLEASFLDENGSLLTGAYYVSVFRKD